MVNWTEVCEQHRGLVFTIARRYLSACIHDPAIDLDDLMQTGFIGLMQAAETHDETKGSFAHWAAYYIRQEIRLLLSMHRKLPRIRVMELSLDAPVMDGEEPSLGDAVAADVDVEAGADRQEITQAVNEAVDRLPDKQRDLVRLCDLQGRSLSDAARVCDTSLPSAQNTHKTALKTLFLTKSACFGDRSRTGRMDGLASSCRNRKLPQHLGFKHRGDRV
jgi:RNA polymerase sigma factor (sigma-70 family)